MPKSTINISRLI